MMRRHGPLAGKARSSVVAWVVACVVAGVGTCCCLVAAAQPAATAGGPPAPVKPGLWSVQILTTFAPDPQPGAVDWPGLPGKPRAHRYDICLDEARARVPMAPPRFGPAAGVKADSGSIQVSDTSTRSVAGAAQSLEWLYRRLSERDFEGSQTITERNVSMTTAYRASFERSDCGVLRPAATSKFGEP